MKKNIFLIFTVLFMAILPVASYAAASFDFNDFAIVDGDYGDILPEDVYLNDEAETGFYSAAITCIGITSFVFDAVIDSARPVILEEKEKYKNGIIYTINTDWKNNLDYECRQNGTVVPAELERCINSLARNRGLLYVSQVHLVRENTGETVTVYFTSNATDNRVWRVVYNNDVNELEGAAEKFIKQRENKILAFWQTVLDKYGSPNSGTDHWISSTNSYDPMLIAYYGALDLVDNGRNATDMVKNTQSARENFRAKSYAF